MSDPTAHVELLRGLVAVPSVHPHEGAAVAYLCDAMTQRGFRAHVDAAGNAIGEIGDGPRHIVMLGHIDTVPGEVPVRIEGDDLYGRGSADAKGPLATFVAATADAATTGKLAGLRVTVIGATGEEAHSPGANYLAATMPAPDACLIGEPGGWESIVLGYKGSMQLRYVRSQANSHSAGQEKPAPQHAADDWNAIFAYCDSLNEPGQREFDRVTPTLRGFMSQSDGLRQKASLDINVRLPPRIAPHDLLAALQELVYQLPDQLLPFFRQQMSEVKTADLRWTEEAERQLEEMMLQIDPGRTGAMRGGGPMILMPTEPPIPAYRCDKNTLLVRALLAGVRSVGGTPKFKTKTGTADMNVVGPVWQCPMAAYGPGDSALDHTPNEHISIAEYLQAVTALTAALGMMGGN